MRLEISRSYEFSSFMDKIVYSYHDIHTYVQLLYMYICIGLSQSWKHLLFQFNVASKLKPIHMYIYYLHNIQCIHQTVDLHYAIASGKRVYPIENSIEVCT